MPIDLSEFHKPLYPFSRTPYWVSNLENAWHHHNAIYFSDSHAGMRRNIQNFDAEKYNIFFNMEMPFEEIVIDYEKCILAWLLVKK